MPEALLVITFSNSLCLTAKKWHSLNRNHWHYATEITGTKRTGIATSIGKGFSLNF